MLELEDRFVKTGFWINRENGYVMGQTLTVKERTGTVIVALLTILTTAGTAQLWNLFTFLYHQYCADGKDGDGLRWQYQALLRTVPSPTALMAETLKLLWIWNARVPRVLLRCSFIFLVALCFAVASIATGISTAFAVDSSNIEVLVNSPFCGRFNYTKVYENRSQSTLLASLDSAVDAYSSNCYQNKTTPPASCRNTFSIPKISFSALPAPCPWNSTMCHSGKIPALVMDSGLLDMRTHFGLNLSPAETVKLQKRTTCSVLLLNNRIIIRDAQWWDARGFNDSKTTIEIGTYRDTAPILRPEATFLQSTALTERQQSYGSNSIGSYLERDKSYLGIDTIPEMRRDDADVKLAAIWLNNVVYTTPVNDPLFQHMQSGCIFLVGGTQTIHTTTPTTRQVLLDAQNKYEKSLRHIYGFQLIPLQYMYCIPQPGKSDYCTSLTGSPLNEFTETIPNLKPVQRRLLQLLRSTSRLFGIEHGAQWKNILASSFVNGRSSSGLPDNQWIKEIIAWESQVWASYQTLLSTAIIGPSVFDEFSKEYTEPVADEGDRKMCQSLKMRKAGGFTNINVFALIFTICFSLIITISNSLILRFFVFMTRFRAALAPRIDHWVQDGVYQLQRRAFEAQDQGHWLNLEQEIPVTVERQLLHQLPVDSSLALKAADRQIAKRMRVGKGGACVSEMVVEDEEEFGVESVVRRQTAGTDNLTLVGVDVEKSEFKKSRSFDEKGKEK
ncbi:hypothetical protein GQ44DRAFT_754658 [Phaeosphaeriaceae sp. PMI808]|nr:hypothetical protein GQ44DRAFT_754658 [Phaeosphaeriaceae sp. PMI808]